MNWNPLAWFKGAPTPPNQYAPNWQPPLNWLKSLTPRTERECLNLFRDTAYFCANLNARGVARTPLCMYRKSGVGMTVGKFARRLKSSYADRETKMRLKAAGYFSDDDEVDEIVGHPFLEMMDRPYYADGVAQMGRFTLLEITQLYLEIVGRAYWELDIGMPGSTPQEFDAQRQRPPSQIFPLIAHEVEPYKEPNSAKFLEYYRYTASGTVRNIPPTEVVPFLCPSLNNPYTGGYSPMMAAGDRVGVSLSYLGQTQAFLDNRARPDMILAPKHPDGMFSDKSVGRITKWLKSNFSRSKVGNPMVLDMPTEMIPLQFALKDLGELQDEEVSRAQIARAFDVPLSMLDKDANLASAGEGRKQHAYDAIEPRCRRLEHGINANIMPRYDASGRTFCMFGEPYKEPLAPAPTDLPSLTGPILMPDESRELLGYGPMPQEYKDEMEKRRQEDMAAKKPPVKPSESKTVEEFRRAIREGRPIGGHRS